MPPKGIANDSLKHDKVENKVGGLYSVLACLVGIYERRVLTGEFSFAKMAITRPCFTMNKTLSYCLTLCIDFWCMKISSGLRR